MKRMTLDRIMNWGTTKKCPSCGAGITAKYRDRPHPKKIGPRKVRRHWPASTRETWLCRLVIWE